MRRIVYRGKSKSTNSWVYGLPFSTDASLNIRGIETWDGERHLIIPYTLGQSTGLYDKMHKEIFEDDIISVGSHEFIVRYGDGSFYMEGTAIPIKYASKMLVIGNIFDPKS